MITLASKRYTLLPYGTTLDSRYPEGGANQAWQLLSGHYAQAKMAPTIIHPRPDSETSSWERNRLAPSGIAWSIPVVVQGGAWPFSYEVVSGPSGLTVGANYGDSGYGVVSWANPTVGTHPVSLRVRTQDYLRVAGSADSSGEVTVEFTLSVVDKENTTYFLFLDATGGSDAASGAFSTPKQTLAGIESATSAGKQVLLRTGTYLTSALTANLDQTDALVWVGYPGESPRIQFAEGKRWTISSTGGAYFGGLNLYGGQAYHFKLFSAFHRFTLFDSLVEAFVYDNAYASGDTNYGCVYTNANAVSHKYLSFVNNEFTNFTGIVNGACVTLYSTEYSVFEGNTLSALSSPGGSRFCGFNAKGHNAYVTMRNNQHPTDNSTLVDWTFNLYLGDDGASGTVDNGLSEICWSYALGANTPIGAAGAGQSLQGNVWTYRNTVIKNIADPMQGRDLDPYQWRFEGNVCLSSGGTSPVAGNNKIDDGGNTRGTYANLASIVDANGLLLDAYLTANSIVRGTRGHEVA